MGEASEVVIPLFGVLDITGEVLLMWAICLVLVVVSAVATRRLRERPGRLQNVLETGIEYLDGFFTGLLGKRAARKYFYFLGSLFIFIIFSNYSGLIPGVGLTPYFKAPTSSLSVTVGLGLLAFVFLQLASLRARGGRGYLKRFITPVAFMLPLLVLDEFIKPASLALRLFGNIFGEETVTEELYNLLPIGAPALMMALSLLFCAIQAVVFTMLVSIYLDEGIEIEEA
ncbi:MAG TPA: F0F1 ATP synthase subunit A [Candidatus Aphodomorpha intestinavium]|uniref:ATP synthase subunit a n=1 Tax=Candidatus Aphodomorpha intestinavium TaxID=2840672 RepID=A0A9D1N3K5_9FIRM|nr:F0F1 ATP synthase subunit A [Candidatus Aphodomorpha intestinavium]